MAMSPSSLPRPTEEDLDFDDPPNYVRDEMQRAFWCISRQVRDILREYRDQPIYFCYHGGYCNFQTDPDPIQAKAFIDSHFSRNPGHRLSTQDRDEWRRLASERRRMRDDLRRRRAEADRGWDHRRPPPVVRPPSPHHGSERRGWSSSRDSPQRYRDRSRESPPPGYRGHHGGYHERSRSPPRRRSRSPYGHRSQSPSPGSYYREGQRNHWPGERRRTRTPSGSPSPPPPRPRSPRNRRQWSPKTRSYPPPPPSHIIDREGDPRLSRSSPHHHRPSHFGSRSPPGSRSLNSPFSSSSGSRERSRDGPSRSSRPPPHFHFPKEYGPRPGAIGRYNSKRDPNYRDTATDDRRPQEWVCSDRGSGKGCTRVFHVQAEYIEHMKTRKLPVNNGNCPEIKVVRLCRDEGSIRGCGKEFNRLDTYQEHINIRNKTRDRRCPERSREEAGVKPEPRPGPLYSGDVMEVDIADSPEYIAPGSPESPVSPPSTAPKLVTPSFSVPDPSGITNEKEASPDRSVSPPPCDPGNPVSVRDDGVILIQPSSSLPDLVTSSNPGPSFKIRIPSRPVEKKPSGIEVMNPPAGEPPGKLDVTPVNRTADSDVTPSTPLMGSLSSAMTGLSPVAKSTPRTLSVASEEKASVSSERDVPVTHPSSLIDSETVASSVRDTTMSDSGLSSSSKPRESGEKEKRGKFKLPSCFADADESSSPLQTSKKVSAKRKSQDDEMELLLDKKKRSQLLKKTPENELPGLKEQVEVVTVNTSTSVDESLEVADDAAQKSEEMKTSQPPKLSFGRPASSQNVAKSINKVIHKPTNNLLASSKVSSSLEKTKKILGKLNEVKPMSKEKKQEKSVVKASKKSKIAKTISKDCSEGKSKKSNKRVKVKSNEPQLFETDKGLTKSFKKCPTKAANSQDFQTKEKLKSKSVDECGKDQEDEASLDDLLADDEEPEKEKPNEKEVTEDEVMERIDALFSSPPEKPNEKDVSGDEVMNSMEALFKSPIEKPKDKDITEDEVMNTMEALFTSPIEKPNKKVVETNMKSPSELTTHPVYSKDAPDSHLESVDFTGNDRDSQEQSLDNSGADIVTSEEAKTEEKTTEDAFPAPLPMASEDQTDYNLIKPEHLLPSESKTSPDKVIVKFSGDETTEMVSIDQEDQDVDSSYEPPLKVTPNTSVSPLLRRIRDKEPEIFFSRDETNTSSEVEESVEKGDNDAGPGDNMNVEEASSSDRETEISIASEILLSPSRVTLSTLREALLDTDEDLEEETEDEDEEDCYELVSGKDLGSECPGCKESLNMSMKDGNVSINLVDFSYIVTCSGCGKRIIIKDLISERQKALLYSN